MGLRSWWTFTSTANEAVALIYQLHRKDIERMHYVYGVHSVVHLNEPYTAGGAYTGGRRFAVAWSGDGSPSRFEAGDLVYVTSLLDDMDDTWASDPALLGTLLTPKALARMAEQEDLRAKAANLF